MLTMRDTIPSAHTLAKAEFATIRLRLHKLGARVARYDETRHFMTHAAVETSPTERDETV